MRKFVLFLGLLFLLSGCSAAQTFETLGPVMHQSEQLPVISAVELALPDSAVAQTFGSDTEQFYECEGYTVLRQTYLSGDFDRTVRQLSGFSPENLTVLESGEASAKRYDWVWTAVGDSGDLVCRAAVLDDGNYHYCICAIAPAADAGALNAEWNRLFASFRLS